MEINISLFNTHTSWWKETKANCSIGSKLLKWTNLPLKKRYNLALSERVKTFYVLKECLKLSNIRFLYTKHRKSQQGKVIWTILNILIMKSGYLCWTQDCRPFIIRVEATGYINFENNIHVHCVFYPWQIKVGNK